MCKQVYRILINLYGGAVVAIRSGITVLVKCRPIPSRVDILLCEV